MTTAEPSGDIPTTTNQSMTRRCWSHVSHAWTSLQVEHQGQYSIEYLHRANKFCQHTGTARSALVLALTPLPCLAAVLAIECVPLDDPSSGVDHAFAFLARVFLVMLVVDCLVLHQLRHLIPTLPTSNALIMASSIFSSLGAAVALFGMAKTIGFPLPFTTLLGAPVTSGLLGACTFAMWARFFRTNAAERKDLLHYIVMVAVQVAVTYVYSTFAFVLAKVDGLWQIPLASLLVVLKQLDMVLIGHLFRDKHDIKANMVVLNANIYHSLFVSWCMNGSRSVYSTLLFVLLDLGETLLAFNSMKNVHVELTSILQLPCQASILSRPARVTPDVTQGSAVLSLIDVAVAIWEHDRDKCGAHPGIRRASDARPVITQRPGLVTAPIHPSNFVAGFTGVDTPASAAVRPVSKTIVPSTALFSSGLDPASRGIVASLSDEDREHCLRLVLQLLHTSEFLLLIEFVEAIIPAIYLVYTAGIYYLPNRNYFDTVRDLDDTKLKSQLANLALYWVIEVGSLALLCWLLQRKLGFSAIKQLAFVLESQWHLVQSKLVLWVVFAVQSRLEHFGTDFSFQFAWLSEKG